MPVALRSFAVPEHGQPPTLFAARSPSTPDPGQRAIRVAPRSSAAPECGQRPLLTAARSSRAPEPGQQSNRTTSRWQLTRRAGTALVSAPPDPRRPPHPGAPQQERDATAAQTPNRDGPHVFRPFPRLFAPLGCTMWLCLARTHPGTAPRPSPARRGHKFGSGLWPGTRLALRGGMWCHIIARSWPGLRPLSDPESCSWLWSHLRARFPAVAAVCLMPDHLHLITRIDDPRSARERLARTLGWFSRRRRPRSCPVWWQPTPKPRAISDARHLRRQIRYVLLNPCRAGETSDPLAWPWTTARDLCGAISDPWVRPQELAAHIGEQQAGFPRRFHAYVSSDPSAAVAGTPFPTPARPSAVASTPLATIRAASNAATRSPVPAQLSRPGLPRNLLVHLALRQGWPVGTALARATGASPRTLRRLAADPPPPSLVAAALCLGDARLRTGFQG